MSEKKELNLISLLPFFGSFIIFLGMIRLIFYYQSFGVNIVNYLDISEIITSFFDILIIVVLQISFSIVQQFLSNSKSENDIRKQKAKEIFEESKFFRRLLKYFSYFNLILINGAALLIVILIWSFFDDSITWSSYIILTVATVTIFLFAIVRFEIEVKHQQFNSNDKSRQFMAMLFNGLLFVLIVISISYSQVISVKNDKKYNGVQIHLDDDTILNSDGSHYFIGKTHNYLFFYHHDEQRTDIYPMNRVKMISFEDN